MYTSEPVHLPQNPPTRTQLTTTIPFHKIRNAENVEEAVALSLIEDLRTDVVTKLKQKIDERASAIFAQASSDSTAPPKAAGDEAGGDSKPQSPFSAMLQAATRYVCMS